VPVFGLEDQPSFNGMTDRKAFGESKSETKVSTLNEKLFSIQLSSWYRSRDPALVRQAVGP
jgi:hypothetical protein